ncbi:MAG: hypothetical protein F6K11_07310 [Leptolyngbya sp. SIO3F4]|nr:hypothetical protein [Leptolyngbya sp. SIO3F4]
MQSKKLQKHTRVIVVLSSIAAGLILTAVRGVGAKNLAVKQVESASITKQHTQNELIRSIWINLNRPKAGYTDFEACDTWLDYGLRALYCHVKPFVNYRQLVGTASLPIFKQGPHTDTELTFQGEYSFGHYNPEFLTWIQEKVIVAPGDRVLKYRFQSVYDSKIRLVARVFYKSHQTLFLTPEEFETVEQDYKNVQKEYQELLETNAVNLLRFAQDPLTFEEIESNYLARLQTKNVPAEDIGFDLGEDCRWLADYLATKYENTFEGEEESHYWYIALTSGGWWVRRSIDGTADQFFEILTQLLEIYDSEWLNEQQLTDAEV